MILRAGTKVRILATFGASLPGACAPPGLEDRARGDSTAGWLYMGQFMHLQL